MKEPKHRGIFSDFSNEALETMDYGIRYKTWCDRLHDMPLSYNVKELWISMAVAYQLRNEPWEDFLKDTWNSFIDLGRIWNGDANDKNNWMQKLFIRHTYEAEIAAFNAGYNNNCIDEGDVLAMTIWDFRCQGHHNYFIAHAIGLKESHVADICNMILGEWVSDEDRYRFWAMYHMHFKAIAMKRNRQFKPKRASVQHIPVQLISKLRHVPADIVVRIINAIDDERNAIWIDNELENWGVTETGMPDRIDDANMDNLIPFNDILKMEPEDVAIAMNAIQQRPLD